MDAKFHSPYLINERKIFQAIIHIERNRGDDALLLLDEVKIFYQEKLKGGINDISIAVQLLIAKANLVCSDPDPFQILKLLDIIHKKQCEVYGLNDHCEIAETLQCKARAHHLDGNYVMAKKDQQEALEMLHKIFPDKTHSKIIHAENALTLYGSHTYTH